jgi:hypothetical protein
MRKTCLFPVFLAVILAFAACSNPASGGGIEGGTPSPTSTTSAIAVTGVSLKTATSILVSHTETLYAIIEPDNATNKNVTWNSSDTSVATVSPTGVVTGISRGTAIITATTVDSGKTANCTVTVDVGVTLTITFTQIADASPSITGPTLYRVSNGGPTRATLTVANSAQYDSISWRVQDTTVTGTDSSFTLSADNAAYNLLGEHFVTVSVMKSGSPYNKTISFKVAY